MKSLFDTQSQTSAAAFATSGFAAHASSTTSPFGTLGTSTIAAKTPSPFAPVATFGTQKVGSSEDGETKSTQPAVMGGFGAFAQTSSSGSGTDKISPFGTTGTAKSGVFGGSIFGGGFGGGFSGAGKLTNFAAPTGDAKLGSANGAVRPIESSNHEGDEDEDSDDEGEGLGEDDQAGADEIDARFQHQAGRPSFPFHNPIAHPLQLKLVRLMKLLFLIHELASTHLRIGRGRREEREASS